MPLRIPEAHKKTVVGLARLQPDQIDDLNRSIRLAPPASSPRALAESVAALMKVAIADLQPLILVLLSLAKTRRQSAVSVGQLAEDVRAAAAEGKTETLALSEFELAALNDRLVLLLSENQTIDVTIRISEVYLAHERLFHSSRILSDIRPVFASDDSTSSVVGMIVHNLELSISENDSRKKLYFALNVHDLRQLSSVIERALLKDQTLRKLISAGEMTYAEDEPSEVDVGPK